MHLFDSETDGLEYRRNIDRTIAQAYKEALAYVTGRIQSYCAVRGATYLLVEAEDSIVNIFFDKLVGLGVLK